MAPDPIVSLENLAFEGGGAKGAAYAGCVEVLDDLGHYANIRRIAGTSAGAMTAAILATGGGSKGLLDVILHTDFRTFVSDRFGKVGDAYRFWTKYGLHTADGFTDILRADIKRFCGDGEITFAGLRALASGDPERFKDLSVVSSNISRQRRQVFDADTAADVEVWLAVRASMSIPLLFEPVEIDGDLFVDGGMGWNYPLDLYDVTTPDPERGGMVTERNQATLGFYLDPHDLAIEGGRFHGSRVDVNSVVEFGVELANFMYAASNSAELHPDDRTRTVFVDDLGVKTTDFGLSGARLEALIDSGRTATRAYFAERAHR